MAERFNTHLAEQNQVAKEEANLRSELAQYLRQLASLDRQGSIPTDEQLSAVRVHRDRGWTAIKARWLNGSQEGAADLSARFEGPVTVADRVSDELRREAERVEQKQTALDDQKRLQESIGGNQQAIQFALAERKELYSQLNILWADAGI